MIWSSICISIVLQAFVTSRVWLMSEILGVGFPEG